MNQLIVAALAEQDLAERRSRVASYERVGLVVSAWVVRAEAEARRVYERSLWCGALFS